MRDYIKKYNYDVFDFINLVKKYVYYYTCKFKKRPSHGDIPLKQLCDY